MVKTIGNVQKDAQVRAVASGALSNGDTIIVNSDGTVSAVAETGGAGTSAEFSSNSASSISSVYDSASNKVVIVYEDLDDSEYGKAVVGSVVGDSITFGSPATFETDKIDNTAMTFDSTTNKVVVCYRDFNNSGLGTAVVGTVSGTSISFGTPTPFKTNAFDVSDISPVFDSNANRVVVSFRDPANSSYGTSVVGTISGTSISFGSRYVFNSAFTGDVSSTFDSNANKVAIFYKDNGNSNYGTGIVGTVSGTSISFGSETIFHASKCERMKSAFETSSGKVVVLFDDDTASEVRCVVGTVSGTSISFGSTVLVSNSTSASPSAAVTGFEDGSVALFYRDTQGALDYAYAIGSISGSTISVGEAEFFSDNGGAFLWDEDTENFIVAYRASSDEGEAYALSLITTNLTSDNFIGFADGAYADTQEAVINSTCSVDLNQTGLTAGQKYYVQTDGSLGTTAADPSVEAGTAISSTEILVKG